jgi:hypothetical protein
MQFLELWEHLPRQTNHGGISWERVLEAFGCLGTQRVGITVALTGGSDYLPRFDILSGGLVTRDRGCWNRLTDDKARGQRKLGKK